VTRPRPEPAPKKPCPICGKPPIDAYVPFCSKRCADVDLHKWLGGSYAVPTDETADDEPPPRRPDDD
jgi:uncharacterized protein